MSEIADLLRLQVNCDKEINAHAVTVTDTAALFTSQLTLGYVRKKFSGYNNSRSSSGELYYGHSAAVSSDTGRPIPKGADKDFHVASAVDVFFVAESGETGDLRVFEGA